MPTAVSDPIDGTDRDFARPLAWLLAVGTCLVFWTGIGLLVAM